MYMSNELGPVGVRSRWQNSLPNQDQAWNKVKRCLGGKESARIEAVCKTWRTGMMKDPKFWKTECEKRESRHAVTR